MPAPRIAASDRPASLSQGRGKTQPLASPLAGVRRFASPAVKAALKRRLFEILGLLCALAGLGLLVALASHDPADPSLSTATTRAPTNLAGPAGATVSDILLQGFGWAGALPGFALLGWAWRLGTHRGLGLFPARLAALLAALPLLAGALTLLPVSGTDAGGVAGGLVAQAVGESAAGLLGPFGLVLGQTMLVALALGLAGAALGLAPAEWLGLGRAARAGAGGVARIGAVGLSRAGGAGARGAAGVF
ncbi:MAG: cell division protein FtsK, partial [Belnapia sp.]|nr:cell division protein FtsK [Belnapia sp.]